MNLNPLNYLNILGYGFSKVLKNTLKSVFWYEFYLSYYDLYEFIVISNNIKNIYSITTIWV